MKRRRRRPVPGGWRNILRIKLFGDGAERYMYRERIRRFGERHPPDLLENAPIDPGPPPPFRPKRLKRYEELMLRKAQALLERGEVVIVTNGGPAWFRLVRFRDGTAVLESRHESPRGGSSGRTRLDGTLMAPRLKDEIHSDLLGFRVRPVAGQEI